MNCATRNARKQYLISISLCIHRSTGMRGDLVGMGLSIRGAYAVLAWARLDKHSLRCQETIGGGREKIIGGKGSEEINPEFT